MNIEEKADNLVTRIKFTLSHEESKRELLNLITESNRAYALGIVGEDESETVEHYSSHAGHLSNIDVKAKHRNGLRAEYRSKITGDKNE